MSKTAFACFLLCRISSTLSFRSILTLFSSCSAAAELTWRFLEAAIFLMFRSRDTDGGHLGQIVSAPCGLEGE